MVWILPWLLGLMLAPHLAFYSYCSPSIASSGGASAAGPLAQIIGNREPHTCDVKGSIYAAVARRESAHSPPVGMAWKVRRH